MSTPIALLCGIVLCFGVGFVEAAPTDIVLPPDLTIEAPTGDVPPTLAALSGKWYGRWHGERTNAFMAEQVIAVERITTQKITVVYAGVGRWGQLNGRQWSWRLDAEYKKNMLVFTLPDGTRITRRLNKDETLDVRGDSSSGSWIGTKWTRLPD